MAILLSGYPAVVFAVQRTGHEFQSAATVGDPRQIDRLCHSNRGPFCFADHMGTVHGNKEYSFI